MVRQCYGRRRKEYLSFLGSSVLLKDFSLIITYGNLFLGKTEIVSVKQMLRYVKQFYWNGFHVFFPICFCRLIHRNMNCACSRSINTSSKVTDPSVDATWLRLQSMQHLGYVCNHHQSPILWMRMVRSDPADFLIHDVADSKLEMFDDFCKKNVPNLMLFVAFMLSCQNVLLGDREPLQHLHPSLQPTHSIICFGSFWAFLSNRPRHDINFLAISNGVSFSLGSTWNQSQQSHDSHVQFSLRDIYSMIFYEILSSTFCCV